MSRRRREAFQLLRVLLVASIVVPALFFGLLGWFTYRADFQEAERELAWVSEVGREHAEKVFDSHRLVADHVAELLLHRSDDDIRASAADLRQQFNRVIADLPQIQSLVVLDHGGHLLMSSSDSTVSPSVDFSDRDYFTALKGGGISSYISRVQTSRVDGRMFFGWGRSKRGDDGAFDGVIDLAISPSFFMRFYETLVRRAGDRVDGRVITMIRDDGQILVRYPAFQGPSVSIPSNNAFFDAVRQNPAAGSYVNHSVVDPDAPARLFAFSKVAGHPVYIVAGRSLSAITGAWRAAMLRYLAVGVPATAVLFLVTLAAVRQARREQAALARLRAEMQGREQVEEQLRQSQKMEAVGQLTGGIAHDFNNLLTGIMVSLELMQKRIGQGRAGDIERYVGSAMASAERAAALTHRLLAFSRRQPLDPKAVDPNHLVASMADLLRRTVGEGIRLDIVAARDAWPTLCDPHQLENALLNLTINARDAMPDGGRLTIATRNTTLRDADVAQHTDVAAGHYVSIEVTDSGVGMAPDVLARAFDPFFTTKPMGQGTGLGLSMIYGFARQSNGLVQLRSEPGRGTAVLLHLPRYEGSVGPEARPPVTGPEISGAGETVLVVEDEDAVRAPLIDLLDGLGYRPIEARDGASGLAILRAAGTIDVLITDVGLPGLNGRRLAELGRLARPELPVLFITGYAEEATFGAESLGPGIRLLPKPFTVETLAAHLTEMLADARGLAPAASSSA